MPDETEESNSFLKIELETLKSIYIDELIVKNNNVGKPEKISIVLFPATADKVDEQYVRITLIFNFSEEYPEKLPEINIRNPRGLSDEMLNRITQDLRSIAEERKGNSMIFELIQFAKEQLTIENRPSGQCAICLHDFSDTDVFTRTECFHYFHSYCLSRYSLYVMQCDEDKNSSNEAMSETSKKELLCPMCRVPIVFQNMEVEYPPPSSADEDTFPLNQELCELQKKMADLYQKQIDKGGIIDIEVEKNKYLLEISNVPTCSNPVVKSNSNSTSPIPETGESKLQEENVALPKSPSKRYPSEETEAKTQNYVKSASKQKFRKPEERRFEPQNNRYNRRYNSHGNARDYQYSNYNSYPNRRPRNFPESRVQEKDPNSEFAHDNGEEIQNSNEPDLNSTNHNDSEETPAEVKQFHPCNTKDQRYNARTKSGFQRKQFLGNSTERNTKSVIASDDISETKASLPLNEEDSKLSGSGQETSTTMKPSRYSKSEKYVSKTTRRDYSYRENNFNERYQSNNDAYNKHSDFQHYNNRPYRQNQQSQRRNYQSNRRNYQHDGERYDGYYSKPSRFNSRGSNRFNEVKHHVNNSSQETDVPENSIDAAETDNNVKDIESSKNYKSNSAVQLDVSNGPRRNWQKSGYRGRNNFRKVDTRIKESYTDIKDSDTQIKDSDNQIKDSDTQIKDSDTQIKDSDAQIKNSDTQIKDTNTHITHTNTQIKDDNTQIKETNTQIQDTTTEIKDTNTPVMDIDIQLQQTERYNRKEARRYPKRDPELYKREHEQYNNRKSERYSKRENERYNYMDPEYYNIKRENERYNNRDPEYYNTKRVPEHSYRKENERYNNRDPEYYNTKREPEHSYRKENETYSNGECESYTNRENECFNKRDNEHYAKRDHERFKTEPEDYHRNEPARSNKRAPEHNRRERDCNNRESELNKREEWGDYNKKELHFNKNSNSLYHGPRRDSRDFQHNSHSRYNQASQDAECTDQIDERNSNKFNRSKCSNQSEQQEQMEYPVVDKQPKDAPVIENHKSQAVSVADNGAAPDMYNSCNFPIIPAPHSTLPPPPGFANPSKKLIYGLSAANPPPGFHKS